MRIRVGKEEEKREKGKKENKEKDASKSVSIRWQREKELKAN